MWPIRHARYYFFFKLSRMYRGTNLYEDGVLSMLLSTGELIYSAKQVCRFTRRYIVCMQKQATESKINPFAGKADRVYILK